MSLTNSFKLGESSAAPPEGDSSEASAAVDGIIDVHSHALLPLWIETFAKKTGQDPANVKFAGAPMPTWTVQQHLATMDRYGIETSILSWPGGADIAEGKEAAQLARAMNEQFAELAEQSRGRLGAFAVIPTGDIDIATRETEYALDKLKLDGVATTTHSSGHYLGNSYFDPWLSELDRRKATLFVHPTVPRSFDATEIGLNPAILDFMFDTTRMVANMVMSGAKARYASVKIICTHGGGTIPYLVDRISALEPILGAGPGRATLSSDEVREGIASFYYDLTAATSSSSLKAIVDLVPEVRLLSGFDYPLMPEVTIGIAKERVASYTGFDETTRRKIFRNNALEIFPRFR